MNGQTRSYTLAEAFPMEQKRVREVLEQYARIGPAGFPARILIRDTLERAEKAAASGNVIDMLRMYEEMKGIN